MRNTKANILLCEDDENLALVMSEYLRDYGYIVTHASNSQEGLEAALNQAYDLCLLDLISPSKNGLDMLRELRASNVLTPVIILSQYNDKMTIIEAYQAGCDDYIFKPVSMDILICKIEAWLRRITIEESNQETSFQLGKVTFNSVKQLLGDEHLSGRESDLLLMLCRKKNQVVERSLILKTLWKVDNYFSSRSLSVYINHLRHLLEKVPGTKIYAVHGKGYKLIVD